MTITARDIWVSTIAYLKTLTSVTSLLTNGGANEIRENQWQGDDFLFPAVRLSVEMFPDITRCRPDKAKLWITAYSEQKSSDESQIIAAAIHTALHGLPFTYLGFRFSIVLVRHVKRPERTVFAWETELEIDVEVSPAP